MHKNFDYFLKDIFLKKIYKFKIMYLKHSENISENEINLENCM